MTARYQRDFDFVTQAIEDGYIFLKSKEQEWGFRFEDVKRRCARRLATVDSDFEFWLLLKEVVAPLHDSHTWIGFDVPWVADRRALPFLLACIGDGCYVAGWREGALPVDEVSVGDAVMSIGGLSIRDLQELYERYEGLSTRAAQAKMWANQLFSYYLPGIDPDLPTMVDLTSVGGQRHSRQAPWVGTQAAPLPDPRSSFSHRWLRTDPPLACLRLRGFFWPAPQDEQLAVARLDVIFEEVQIAEGLVIDARGCGGGSFTPMKELIARLVQAPVPNFRRRWLVSDNFLETHELGTQFAGKAGLTECAFDGGGDLPSIEPSSAHRLQREVPTLIITDFQTLSRTEELIVLLKEAGVAKTVGETTGGGYGVPLRVSLPATGWDFRYSVCEGRSPNGLDIEGRGIEPDYPVALRRKDLGSGRDRYMDEAERLLLELVR